MEVYFKDLISKESSLDKLVDDLSRIVQGADDLAEAMESTLPADRREQLEHRLNSLKANCSRIREQAMVGARATDKLLRDNLYSSLIVTFGLGLLLGAKFFGRKD